MSQKTLTYRRVEIEIDTDTIIFVTEFRQGGMTVNATFERVPIAQADEQQLIAALEYLWPDVWEELDADVDELHDLRERVREAA